MLRKFLIYSLFSSLSLCILSCDFVITAIAGNFTHQPKDMKSKLSAPAQRLLDQAFNGIKLNCLSDFHVHAVATDSHQSGAYINPEMLSLLHPWKHLQFLVYSSASGIKNLKNANQEYLDRLLALASADKRYGKLHLLAFDYHYNSDGTRNLENSTFHIPNKYVFDIAQKYPELITAVISVHPDKPGAASEIEKWGQKGVKFIKWLPNAQRIDPSLIKHFAYYQMVKKYDMAILSHTGHEKAVDGEDYQELANPLNFKYPLDLGVKIIMAHLASLGECQDLDSATKEMKSCFDLFLRLFENPKYKKNLFGELSGTTIHTRVGAPLLKLLERPDLHDRLVNGSDYPLPAINILYRTKQLLKLGYITESERNLANEIYGFNPLLFDFVLKRLIKHPKTGQKFQENAFEMPSALASCSRL
jgi:uncharacterized protein